MCGALIFGLIPGIGQAWQDGFEDLARRAEAAIDSNPAEAADLFKKALALKADWAEGWLYLGASLFQLDRFAEASDAFRKGTGLAPTKGTGWAFLGLCEAELDNSDQAIADIRKGEQLGLGDNWQFEVVVRIKAAQTLIRAAAFDEALAQMVPLSTHNENSPLLRETMGLCALAIATSASDLPPERRAVAEGDQSTPAVGQQLSGIGIRRRHEGLAGPQRVGQGARHDLRPRAGLPGGMPSGCTRPAATCHRRSTSRPTISYRRPPRPREIQSAESPRNPVRFRGAPFGPREQTIDRHR